MNLPSIAVDDVAGKTGLSYWMGRVLHECDRVSLDFAPDPVHDLRVALRRCRSIARGYSAFDPNRPWNELKKESARLFRRFAELRDTQVMIEWVRSPDAPKDAAAMILLDRLSAREAELKEAAARALGAFDRERWMGLGSSLDKRARRIPRDSMAFRHLALELWCNMRYLHRQALRNRTHIAFHRLRISLKKLRYLAENFLPDLAEAWGEGLRELQNLLGDMHDLHVLMQTAVESCAIREKDERIKWHSWSDALIAERLDHYRRLMTGAKRLWPVWRASLPDGAALESSIMERLRMWASFRDPDCARSQLVARLSTQLYDGLTHLGLAGDTANARARSLLRAAALLHAVGFARGAKKGRRRSHRRISALAVPVGWNSMEFRTVALAVLHQRGALPKPGAREMSGLAPEQKQLTVIFSAILRIAVTLASSREKKISQLSVRKTGDALVILATGFQDYTALAQKLARARYLLEIACGLPVVVRAA